MADIIDAVATQKAMSVLSVDQLVDLRLELGRRLINAVAQVDHWEGSVCYVTASMEGARLGSILLVSIGRTDGLHAFSMQIAEVRDNPPGLGLICSGPYEKTQRRRHVRRDQLHIRVGAWREGTRVPGVILRNVSAGGLGILCPVRLAIGDELEVEFNLPGRKVARVLATARVRRAGPGENYGLQFDALPHVTGERIMAWVFSQLRRDLAGRIR